MDENELSREELDALEGEELPEREVMSILPMPGTEYDPSAVIPEEGRTDGEPWQT
jgi:hypothetical protein